ncbi:MAG TPA: hypothetical protein VJL90_13925 [Pseudorhodoplanes sp.]|nr:hypothetical protein [Pseudorhodoplanes sp.]
MTNARFVTAVRVLINQSIVQFALVIMALLLPIAPTMAQDHPTDAQCRNFADFAVRNAQRVRDLNCSTLPWNDPTLSLNKDYHFRWCRMMRTETVEKMMEVLFAQSSKCEYCRNYADTVTALYAEMKELLDTPIPQAGSTAMVRINCRKNSWGWDSVSSAYDQNGPHVACMKSEVVKGGSHYYDVASVKPELDQVLGEMAREVAQCKKTALDARTRTLSAAPQCVICHPRSTTGSPASLQPGPKRVSTDPAIARQPPAFTPVPERRRTPHDTGRNTSSGSDQVKRGDPASGGSSGSAMDRLGGGGAGGAPSGGSQSGGGAAPKSSGGGGGASSASPSANNPAPNINSNTIKQQAPAFGPTPGLR